MTNGFEVLDVHHHVGNAFRASAALSTPPPNSTRTSTNGSSPESRLEIMDRSQVQQAIVIPGHGHHRSNGIADTRAENTAIAAYRDRTPGAVSRSGRDCRAARRRRQLRRARSVQG
ncbi:MAG: hypothetical protein R2789_09900 [Microthrixaceae bacterium]